MTKQPGAPLTEAGESAESAKKRVVVVLGMHRSGTSLLTNLLGVLGVELGEDLLAGNAGNEMGYWENEPIYRTQDALLNYIAKDWGGHGFAYPFTIDWERLPEFRTFQDELVSIVRREVAGAKGIWGFKDPRTCRLLPLWKQVFAELNLEPLYVLAVRSPAEVAESLRKRDDLDPLHSELLWLLHTLDAVRDAGEELRIVVDYARWFTAPLEQAQAVAKALGLAWPADDRELVARLTGTIRPDLRHAKARKQGSLPFVVKTYEALQRAAATGLPPDETARGEIQRASECLGAALELSAGTGKIALALGHAEARAGNHEAALAAFTRATRLQPRLASAHTSRALVLHLLGRSSEATDSIHQALSLDPNGADTLRILARIYVKNNQFEAAERTCRLILQQNADDAQGLEMLDEVVSQKEKIKQAADKLFGQGAKAVMSVPTIVPAPIRRRNALPSVPGAAAILPAAQAA
jgi:hypothetical protein